jgi:hypothetical protein
VRIVVLRAYEGARSKLPVPSSCFIPAAIELLWNLRRTDGRLSLPTPWLT